MTTAPQHVSEREELIAILEKSRDCFLQVIASVPEHAAGTRLREDSWSILEIVEHLAAAEKGMLRLLEMSQATAAPGFPERDERIIAAGTNRERKISAPEVVLPKGRWKTLAECASAFEERRARSLEYARTADNLRGRIIDHPRAGEIDGYQQMLIMAGHAERHALQIEEIKNSAVYLAAERG